MNFKIVQIQQVKLQARLFSFWIKILQYVMARKFASTHRARRCFCLPQTWTPSWPRAESALPPNSPASTPLLLQLGVTPPESLGSMSSGRIRSQQVTRGTSHDVAASRGRPSWQKGKKARHWIDFNEFPNHYNTINICVIIHALIMKEKKIEQKYLIRKLIRKLGSRQNETASSRL